MQQTQTNNQNKSSRPVSCRKSRPGDETAGRGALAAERLEAASRLAGWLAHQINNPLGAVSGNAQLLARRLQRDISDSDTLKIYLRHLETIQSQTERCAAIVSEVLSFAHSREPEIRKLDVPDIVAEAVKLVSYAHPESRIDADMKNAEEIPAVRADREWLARTLFELLSNAVEASPAGCVSVKVEAASEDGSEVHVKVTDSGPGIADDVLPRVFDPFFSTREKSRGLGLTLSLELMQRMGGSLHIERSNDDGCVFKIGIPMWRQTR